MIVFAPCVPAASIHHPEQQCQLPPACNLWTTLGTGGRGGVAFMFVSSRTGRIADELDELWHRRYGASGSVPPKMQMPLERLGCCSAFPTTTRERMSSPDSDVPLRRRTRTLAGLLKCFESWSKPGIGCCLHSARAHRRRSRRNMRPRRRTSAIAAADTRIGLASGTRRLAGRKRAVAPPRDGRLRVFPASGYQPYPRRLPHAVRPLLTSRPYCDILQHIPIYYQYREPPACRYGNASG
jgi:hypothetical protein